MGLALWVGSFYILKSLPDVHSVLPSMGDNQLGSDPTVTVPSSNTFPAATTFLSEVVISSSLPFDVKNNTDFPFIAEARKADMKVKHCDSGATSSYQASFSKKKLLESFHNGSLTFDQVNQLFAKLKGKSEDEIVKAFDSIEKYDIMKGSASPSTDSLGKVQGVGEWQFPAIVSASSEGGSSPCLMEFRQGARAVQSSSGSTQFPANGLCPVLQNASKLLVLQNDLRVLEDIFKPRALNFLPAPPCSD